MFRLLEMLCILCNFGNKECISGNHTNSATALIPFGPQGEIKSSNVVGGLRWENNLIESTFAASDGVGAMSTMDTNALLQSEVKL